MDFRVEGFHTAVEKFRGAGVFGDIDDGQSGVAEGFGRSAGGEEFDAEVVEFLGKVGEAGFIGDGEQGAGDGHGCVRSRGKWRSGGGAAPTPDAVTEGGAVGKRNRAGVGARRSIQEGSGGRDGAR